MRFGLLVAGSKLGRWNSTRVPYLQSYYPLEKKHHSTKKGDYGNRNTLKELPVCRNYPMAPVQEYYRKPVRNYLYRNYLYRNYLYVKRGLRPA